MRLERALLGWMTSELLGRGKGGGSDIHFQDCRGGVEAKMHRIKSK